MFARTNALLAHEETIPEHKNALRKRILDSGQITPIVADFQSRVVLDGHHRLQILRELGYAVIPVKWVDYQSESIQVTKWQDGAAFPKEAVLAAAERGQLFSPKTTRHTLFGRHVNKESSRRVALAEWMRQ